MSGSSMNRKAVFVILLGAASLFPVEAVSQNIFQKFADKVSSWFSGGDKDGDALAAEHTDIARVTLDENISIPDLVNQARKNKNRAIPGDESPLKSPSFGLEADTQL